jgi:hypothetical protein
MVLLSASSVPACTEVSFSHYCLSRMTRMHSVPDTYAAVAVYARLISGLWRAHLFHPQYHDGQVVRGADQEDEGEYDGHGFAI